MKQDIAEIAGKLTKAQRDRIMTWREDGWYTALPSSERREFAGLVRRAGYCNNRFTSLGLAVRAHLLAHSYTEKTA